MQNSIVEISKTFNLLSLGDEFLHQQEVKILKEADFEEVTITVNYEFDGSGCRDSHAMPDLLELKTILVDLANILTMPTESEKRLRKALTNAVNEFTDSWEAAQLAEDRYRAELGDLEDDALIDKVAANDF